LSFLDEENGDEPEGEGGKREEGGAMLNSLNIILGGTRVLSFLDEENSDKPQGGGGRGRKR
jgi:hypothetical protein